MHWRTGLHIWRHSFLIIRIHVRPVFTLAVIIILTVFIRFTGVRNDHHFLFSVGVDILLKPNRFVSLLIAALFGQDWLDFLLAVDGFCQAAGVGCKAAGGLEKQCWGSSSSALTRVSAAALVRTPVWSPGLPLTYCSHSQSHHRAGSPDYCTAHPL